MATYEEKEWLAMLGQLAGRDAPVELSRQDANDDGPAMSYRTRLFEVEPDGAIIVERPSQAATDNAFTVGQDIELLLMDDGERLLATCTVREIFVKQINSDTRVSCYRLSPGRRPVRDQRRTFYRVNVAGSPLDPVVLESAGTVKLFKTEGRLVNLSGGGFGVSVRADTTLLRLLKQTRTFICTAYFEDNQMICEPMKVTHLSALGDDLLYLGLHLTIDDEAKLKTVQEQLVHLCNHYQRLQLQRRRA